MNTFQSVAFAFSLLIASFSSISQEKLNEHDQWLKDTFSDQHQALVPVVAMANIFAGCNQIRKTSPVPYQVKDIVEKMDVAQLSEKLALCLGNDTLQSDNAINFGLISCFQSQVAHLPKAEQNKKMSQVTQALMQLSLAEKQKSFTECSTFQAIDYLK